MDSSSDTSHRNHSQEVCFFLLHVFVLHLVIKYLRTTGSKVFVKVLQTFERRFRIQESLGRMTYFLDWTTLIF
jgi:hypothetical protein